MLFIYSPGRPLRGLGEARSRAQGVTARARASLGSRISGFRRAAFVRHQYKHPSQHVTARARASLGSRREQVTTASVVQILASTASNGL